jgi:hypothetical protein
MSAAGQTSGESWIFYRPYETIPPRQRSLPTKPLLYGVENRKRFGIMKKVTSLLWAAALAAAVGSTSLMGQDSNNADPNAGGGRRNRGGGQGGPGGGNFDPAQMRQRMMERYREQLEVKDDTEWKIISERIEKVSDARRDLPTGRMGMFGRGGPGGPGGAGGGGGQRGGNPFGGTPLPEQEALQKALESNASADEVKSKLAAYREAVKQKEAKLEKTQAELRAVLSAKQEAHAVLAGLLK